MSAPLSDYDDIDPSDPYGEKTAAVQADTDGAYTPEGPFGAVLSDLSILTADAETDISRVSVFTLDKVNGREGYSLRVQVGSLGSNDVEKWRKIAANGQRGGKPNPSHWYALILANQTEQILKDGKPFADADGNPFTFRDEELQAALGAQTAAAAVRKLIGADPVLIAIGSGVLTEAGFGEDAEAVDPEVPGE